MRRVAQHELEIVGDEAEGPAEKLAVTRVAPAPAADDDTVVAPPADSVAFSAAAADDDDPGKAHGTSGSEPSTRRVSTQPVSSERHGAGLLPPPAPPAPLHTCR